jgi:hypothetical protein
MTSLSFHGLDAWWWPWVFLTLAGWFANDVWRLLGVAFSGRLTEESEVFAYVKAVATALVAGVIAQLVFQPGGDLAETSLVLRLTAVACGFGAFRLTADSVGIGVVVGEAVFFAGRLLGL